MNWKVPYIDLPAQYQSLKPELDAAITRVMASGRYIGGEEVERFEAALGRYLGVKHVVSCGNGYDALYMALKVIGASIDDNSSLVCTKDYTHVSTHAAVENAGYGATLVTKAYPMNSVGLHIPVHMNGRCVFPCAEGPDYVIEDACQAIGASYEDTKAGTYGIMGCFSFHPMKVLGCAGDGGAIVTNDDDLDAKVRAYRNHGGGKGYGVNSRLDAIQAAILNVKLPHLDKWIARRRAIAALYEELLPAWVKKPPAPSDGPYFDTYSSYVIGGSPELLAHLRGKGIECFSHIRTDVVSLPIYPEMKDSHIAMVVAAVKGYTNG